MLNFWWGILKGVIAKNKLAYIAKMLQGPIGLLW